MSYVTRMGKPESEEEGDIRRERMRTSFNNDPVYYYNSRGGVVITYTYPCDCCDVAMVSEGEPYYTLNDSYDLEDLQRCVRFNKPLPKRIRMHFRDVHYCEDMRFLKSPNMCAGYTDEEDFNGVMCEECSADYWKKKEGI